MTCDRKPGVSLWLQHRYWMFRILHQVLLSSPDKQEKRMTYGDTLKNLCTYTCEQHHWWACLNVYFVHKLCAGFCHWPATWADIWIFEYSCSHTRLSRTCSSYSHGGAQHYVDVTSCLFDRSVFFCFFSLGSKKYILWKHRNLIKVAFKTVWKSPTFSDPAKPYHYCWDAFGNFKFWGVNQVLVVPNP